MKIISRLLLAILLSSSAAHATLPSTNTRVQYNCDGATTTFAYDFTIYEDDDLDITKASPEGLESTLVLNTDYTVTGSGDVGGGNVVLTGTCEDTYTLTILRDIELTQDTDYVDGEFFSADALELPPDKLSMIAQQQQEQLDRTPKLAKSSAYATTGYTFPDPIAGRAVGWNSAGSDLTTYATSNVSVPQIDYIGNYADLATAVATIGSNPTTLMINTATTIADGVTVTIPSTMTLWFTDGGMVQGTAGGLTETLTINGGIDAGLFKIFGDDLTVGGLTVASPEWWGSIPDGSTDSTTAIQAAIDSLTNGGLVKLDVGTYLVSDSGVTVIYRATTTKVGVALKSNVALVGLGQASVIKTADASFCVPIVADGVSNVFIDKLRIEGNAANNQSGLPFGVYYYNTNLSGIGDMWVDDSYDNCVEIIKCIDITLGNISCNTSGPSSKGGGIQIEDSEQVTCVYTFGSTFDDFVSVIAHDSDVSDIDFLSIISTGERAFYLGQSASATGTYTMSNITADVISSNSLLTAAVKIFRNGIYKNISIKQVDRGSVTAFSLQPWEDVGSGEIYNSSFDITSYDAVKKAVEIVHNDLAATIIENNSIKAHVINSNTGDVAAYSAVDIQAGDFWDIDVIVDYTIGLTNPGTGAVSIGGSGTNDVVRSSRLSGNISGADTNLRLNNTLDLQLGNLILRDSENTNVALDITSLAINTKLGVITSDKETMDNGVSTSRTPQKLNSNVTEVTTLGSTVETDLISYTVPAFQMGEKGILHIKANGTIVGSVGTKVFKFYVGGSILTLQSAINNVGDWSADIYMYMDNARAAQKFDVRFSVNGSTDLIDFITKSVSGASDFTIKFTGTTSDATDEIIQETMLVVLM